MARILLAEDDTSMREYLQRALQRVGYEVQAVGCGTEAMPLLESEQFDLLLTDIVMPEMDGIELAQKASAIDPSITTSERGIWAIKWSFIGLAVTALLQIVVVLLSHSVGLLADAIHNFGDAATAIPLWSAFMLSRWKPNEKFTYGYGRVEDLAGMAIVLTIFVSAVAAGYETVQRFSRSQPVGYLWAVMAASVIGFIGNEAVAILRIRVGREIESAALIADGYHARIDGWTSLAVFFGEVGVWMGYALADPIVGALITIAIAQIVWRSAKAVFTRRARRGRS